jgi:large subunit ribosomal protein L25
LSGAVAPVTRQPTEHPDEESSTVSEVRIAAESRTEFGKGAARRIRRAQMVPAVLYGHGADVRHISLPGHELMKALKTPNVLLTVELDGSDELALPKAVQRDPIKGFLEHVDLVVVRRGERVIVDIPVHVTGAPAPDTLVSLEQPQLSIEAEATHLPDGVDVSVEGLPAGSQIHAKDITLPSGTTLATDAEALVVNITAAPTAEMLEAELAEAEADLGIVHDATDEELAAQAAEAPEGETSDDGGEPAPADDGSAS